MKKSIKILFILCFCILLIGCSNKKEEIKKDDKEVDQSLFIIKDKEFHMDTDKVFQELKYTVSKDFREINNETPSSKYVQYDYRPENESNYLFFRIFYYPGKDFEFAKKDMLEEDYSFTDGKTDNLDYKMIDLNRTDGTIHIYFINKEGSTYVVYFTSSNDIKDFETKVINSLKF